MDRMGTRHLQETLNDHLGKHIKDKLPGLRSNLSSKARELEGTLKDLGYFGQEVSKNKLLHNVVNRFVNNMETNLEGNTTDVSGSSLKAGVNINRTIYGDVYSLIRSTVIC